MYTTVSIVGAATMSRSSMRVSAGAVTSLRLRKWDSGPFCARGGTKWDELGIEKILETFRLLQSFVAVERRGREP